MLCAVQLRPCAAGPDKARQDPNMLTSCGHSWEMTCSNGVCSAALAPRCGSRQGAATLKPVDSMEAIMKNRVGIKQCCAQCGLAACAVGPGKALQNSNPVTNCRNKGTKTNNKSNKRPQHHNLCNARDKSRSQTVRAPIENGVRENGNRSKARSREPGH